MAEKYRKISPRVWNDVKFRRFSNNAKLVFFMLLTHPSTSAIGTLRSYVQGLAPELGWSEEVFREAFGELLSQNMVVYAEKDGLIWLPNFMKYNIPESPNVLKSWYPSWNDCPECELKNVVYLAVKKFSEGFQEAFQEAFHEAFEKESAFPLPNQEQEQEQELREEKANAFLSKSPPDGEPCDDNSEPLGCPHKQIVELYHEILPELPRVRKWREAKAKQLRTRWREKIEDGKISDKDCGIAYFKRFFEHVKKSDFLMGRVCGKGRSPFYADLGWLVVASNFDKVISGKYHDREVA